MMPVIRRADRLSPAEIGDERRRLVEAVRNRKIADADLAGATFSITNLGMYPIDRFIPLLQPPQSAMLSVGRVRDESVPDSQDGHRGRVRPALELGLTLDHRVLDGAGGAAFLKDLIARLETLEPEV
jgi:pyruvate dehydrogenase E2 component (dihydrolipoamide acetyltransferase)